MVCLRARAWTPSCSPLVVMLTDDRSTVVDEPVKSVLDGVHAGMIEHMYAILCFLSIAVLATQRSCIRNHVMLLA